MKLLFRALFKESEETTIELRHLYDLADIAKLSIYLYRESVIEYLSAYQENTEVDSFMQALKYGRVDMALSSVTKNLKPWCETDLKVLSQIGGIEIRIRKLMRSRLSSRKTRGVVNQTLNS